jgi:polo-like kinase 1
MSTAHKDDVKEVPDIVDDNSTGTRYLKGKFLGKGGFARCYELINERTKQIVAGKIVSKSMLARKNQREKVRRRF